MPSSRHALGASVLVAGALTSLLALACDDRRAPTEARQGTAPQAAVRPAAEPTTAVAAPGGDVANASHDLLGNVVGSMTFAGALTGMLPTSDTVTSGVPAFEIKQKGGGIAGRFEITNPNSAAIALDGVNSGTGHALLAWNYGRGRGAVIITSNSLNQLPALDVSSQSLGQAGTPGLAAAMDVRANNSSSTLPAVQLSTLGQGTVLRVNHRGPTGDLAEFQVAGANLVRIDRSGRGFFNGGTRNSGADVAEALAPEGRSSDYEPGDVLVISDSADKHVERSTAPYSTRVIGVHATRPGVLLTERSVDASTDDLLPVGVIGVIPTKVSAENGAIRRGDLLVTASLRGHAMRGTKRDRMLGAVLGKALAEFSGPGTGIIPVLVNVK